MRGGRRTRTGASKRNIWRGVECLDDGWYMIGV